MKIINLRESDDFIRLGQAFEESQAKFNKMNTVLKKCNWENRGKDDDGKDKDED